MLFSRFLQPKSIAVFGGSEVEEVIRQCDRMGYQGDIWPVHPTKTQVLGRKVFSCISQLPASPDAAYIAVNRHLTVDIVEKLADIGAGGAICYASGFNEAGVEGIELAERLKAVSQDMPVLGPNCYGMLNYVDNAILWPDQQGGRHVDKGVAIITQSSNIALNFTMQQCGLPIAYVVSLGNKLKFDLHDAITEFAKQDSVSAIGLHIEGITDPLAFNQAVKLARELGKPVVAIKAGRSEGAQKMALSHTASLTGSDELMDALFIRCGVARVYSLDAMVEALKVLHLVGPLKGYSISAMAPSGGDASLMADAVEGSKLVFTDLSEKAEKAVRDTVHEIVTISNPFDYHMFDWGNQQRLANTFSAFIGSDFDFSLCLFDYPREDICDTATWQPAEDAFIEAIKRTGKKGAVLATMVDGMSEDKARRLMNAGVVPLRSIDAALAGVRAAAEIGEAWSKPSQDMIQVVNNSLEETSLTLLDEAEGKALLSNYGVPVPKSYVVSTPKDVEAAMENFTTPVVVKVLGVAHKTDVGGVKLNIRGCKEALEAVETMGHLSDRFIIEEMVEGAVAEIIVGVVRDEQFGPYLVIGAGGILVELMKDSCSLLLPTSKKDILQALNGLRSVSLFHGFRGRPKADLDAAADAILSIAHFAQENSESLAELDVNPLIVRAQGEGVCAADALIRKC